MINYSNFRNILLQLSVKQVFDFNSYKKYLNYRVNVVGERGIVTQLAEAAGCQRTYLSKVVNAEVHLTPDQAFRVCSFWQFSPDEKNYFLLLVDRERAGDKAYRDYLGVKLKALKIKHQDLSQRVKNRKTIQEEDSFFLMKYYSSWVYSAIHFLTSIPSYQDSKNIAARLNLSEENVLRVLEDLRENSYVAKNRRNWIYHSGENHLAKISPLLNSHLNNWRSRALLNAQNKEHDDLHFSLVQSLSLSDREKLKNLILNFLDDFAKRANPSSPEELICLNLDFFKV
ncbi:MAG: hypothetical protein CL674_03060 [Bdellovibrionaceae bacterium]|nr:hypothetical protein [Pseudobdellovibrionaceae bacterium]